MKTPNLLEVPKDSPTRKERIEAFKALHQIETRDAGWSGDEYPRWIAGHLPSCRKLGYGVTPESDLFDCSMKVGRLMDESGCADYGTTERAAIIQLCENLSIPCDL